MCRRVTRRRDLATGRPARRTAGFAQEAGKAGEYL
jgi:hypothetical protein